MITPNPPPTLRDWWSRGQHPRRGNSGVTVRAARQHHQQCSPWLSLVVATLTWAASPALAGRPAQIDRTASGTRATSKPRMVPVGFLTQPYHVRPRTSLPGAEVELVLGPHVVVHRDLIVGISRD